ncbi:MAG: methylmalonyl-CoA mutase [Verrucomicrobia bacterium]|nr:MAG: methylmalonyl-CoA mutase [Verrucomicrobiota bacterium]PYL39854.1 MAG: methylmalonyl-CoA mutase [Verrucomicrobiota bacterium]
MTVETKKYGAHRSPLQERSGLMNKLGQVVEAVEKYNQFVLDEVKRARADEGFGREVIDRWHETKSKTLVTHTPTGLPLPRLALPEIDEPGEIARYLFGDGLPGEFPFLNGVYREMYLEPIREIEAGSFGKNGEGGNAESKKRKIDKKKIDNQPKAEEPTRLFSGLMLAEDTNERFHYLTAHQRTHRLSTAFDGPTLYGIDSDADGVFGKIGEGGVAIDTVEDMVRLYDGFDLGSPDFSASMTISGPAPIIMAMYIAAAKRRFGPKVVPKLRGTIQADIFKEVQAQNETIFPTEASLRFLTDMVEFTTREMPRWYPISISGYHIGEAGSTPVQQAAYTLSNGFAYAEMFAARGIPVDQFGPRLSFFLDCGLDIEYIALARVSRRIWAIGMRDVFGAGARAQLFKLHTQTSGRSLIAAEFKNNLTRTAAELMLAYMNATNSCHSNSADEPFTTPSEEWIRLAAHGQAILLEESGIFKHTMNLLSGSPGMKAVERAVEKAILDEFREIERLGGVLAAVEDRFQRSQIQSAAHRYEQQIYDGTRPIIGLNRYRNGSDDIPEVKLTRTPRAKQKLQVDRLAKFKKKNAEKAKRALDKLADVVERGENCFSTLLEAVEVCSLGQIAGRLQEVVGRFRPMV